MRRLTAILLTFAFAAAACGSDTTDPGASGTTSLPDKNSIPTTTTSGPATTTTLPGTSTVAPTTTLPIVELGDLMFVSALVPFTACDDLLTYLWAEASARVGPYGLQGGGWYGGPMVRMALDDVVAMAMPESVPMGGGSDAPTASNAVATQADGGSSSLEAGVDFSGTNVQELGIDEPDLIKTDGNRILIVEDQWLHHVDVSSGTAVLTDSIELTGHWGSEMLLDGDRLLVLAQTEGWVGEDGSVGSGNAAVSRLVAPGNYKSLTTLIEVDLSDQADLSIANTLTVE
ncbi:MAG: beta-propeller domain-containing protein, partial [Acidimicrobiales bacterium]|nr:beta-propeller domain-containing protein [Acidimicrobiales bacterium]